MEKSFLQDGLQAHSLSDWYPLLCLGMFQDIPWDKEALDKKVTRCQRKEKSILSILGAQQSEIWNSLGEFSVFFFFLLSSSTKMEYYSKGKI